MARIACDVHTHTLFSRHAYSTVQEDVFAAEESGMELLGVTDHYSSMLFDECTLKDFGYFLNLSAWPRVWHGVRVLHGCEADIVDLEGHIFGYDIPVTHGIDGDAIPSTTLKSQVLCNCDYAIASVHGKDWASGASITSTTQMYLNALQDPKVLILGHVGRAGVPFDLDAVLTAARDLGKMIEINEQSLRRGSVMGLQADCRRIAVRCAELGTMVSFGSDAHVCTEVGSHGRVSALLDEIHFPEELVACRSAEAFETALHAALG